MSGIDGSPLELDETGGAAEASRPGNRAAEAPHFPPFSYLVPMKKPLYFSANEQTEQQRRDVVKCAVGVSLSQSRHPSPLLVALQNQYIAGEIDLEQLSARLDAEYQPAPGPDPAPKYAAGEGPYVEPAQPYEPYLHFDESLAPLSL